MRLQFWKSEECGAPLYCHYSQFDFDYDFVYMLGCHSWVILTSLKIISIRYKKIHLPKKKILKNAKEMQIWTYNEKDF